MSSFLLPILIPLSWVYGLIVWIRNFCFDIGLFKSTSSNIPIISIGNIVVGGTGKTPMVIFISKLLLKYNYQPGIVSRGYGRNSNGTLVSHDGNQQLLDVTSAGDEPFLMGKLEFMQSRNSLQNGDYDDSIEYIDNCIDFFEVSEQKHFIIASYIEKQIILIAKGEDAKASKLISKIEMIKNKIDNPPNRPIINILKLYLENKNIEEEFDFDNITGDFQTDIQLSYWYTAKYFSLNDQIDKAKIYQDKAVEIINKSAEKISNKKDREIFINNEYFNKLIQEDLAKQQPATIEKKPPEDAPPSVFAFCPSCGFKNENSFGFCPSCGNDLKQ